MTQPAISKHLKVLERAGLISRDRDAQRRPSRLDPKPLAEATEWLEGYRQFWETSFRRLDGSLDGMRGTAKQRKRPAGRKRLKGVHRFYPDSFKISTPTHRESW